MKKMKSNKIKSKISTIAIITLLAFSVFAVALPTVQAQNLIMNCGTSAIVNFNFDVDLNGPSSQLEGLKFAWKGPSMTDFELTTDFPIDNEPGLPGERYVTDPGGDCDIDVIFPEVGEWQVKWVHPASGAESNVVTVDVQLEVVRTTYPYLGVIPNPVGVNQMVLFHVGITRQTPSVEIGWEGLSIEIKKPNGEIQTIENIKTDSTGGTGATFTPTMVGTYEAKTIFPKQQGADGVHQDAAESEVVYIEVQADPVPYYPGHAMPKEYWTRPIDANLREWYRIAGNWRDIGYDCDPLYAPYNDDAPETAHILWTKPMSIGGLIGGEVGEGKSYTIGDAYEGKFPDRLILAGRLYYTVGGSRGVTRSPYPAPIETICVDLHTGEEYWRKAFPNNATISFATTIWWDGFNHHGGFPYLFISSRGTWDAYDAFTGDWRFTIENLPSGDTHLDPATGEPQILTVDTRNNQMRLWRTSTYIKSIPGSTGGSWGNTIEGQTHDADDWGDRAIEWEVDIPDDLQGGLDWVLPDRVIGATLSYDEVTLWGLSTEPGREGDLLFQNTWIPPTSWEEGEVTVSGFGGGWMLRHDNVAVLWIKETREYYGFSLETGEYMWGPTEPQYYLDAVDDTPTASRAAAYGYFYSLSLGGIVYCYDIQTGETEWTYPIEDYYQEFLFANNWWGKPVFIADGKIYLGHTEHSPIDPRPRGAPFVCLDAYTGELIFRADNLFRSTRWGGRAIIGDSIMATQDTYDQRIYAVGKGPSALTVAKTGTVAEKGSAYTIEGTVMDVSPGTQDDTMKLRFPYGVPAVSDASQSAWMLYVYKNFERPTDTTGVPIKIEVMTPSGQYQNLGTTTSDAYGNWAFGICPEEAGTYMIIATFEGSEAYYGATQTGYLTVADPLEVDVDTAGIESAVNDAKDTVSGLTTYVLAILVLVIIALLIAIYTLLKK
jgi:hypothetical protein